MKLQTLMVIAFGIILSFAFTTNDFQDVWEVPAKYEKMKNPQASNGESLKIGKQLWNKHCGSCHGKEGLGDGSKAAQLDTPCGDFTTAEFQAQSDGALFYKTIEGRGDMPSFQKKIPYEEDIWHLVNFMRTLE